MSGERTNMKESPAGPVNFGRAIEVVPFSHTVRCSTPALSFYVSVTR